MNSNHTSALASLRFCLTDESPGPAVGAVAEHIEQLVFDPWSSDPIDLIHEFEHGRMVVPIFAVTRPADSIQRLGFAHEAMNQSPVISREL